jgi:anti-sigma B factor antagonist
MPLQKWSDNILVVDLQNEPQFSDDMNALFDALEAGNKLDVVLNFTDVTYVNSSNIARMLKLRKTVLSKGARLVLCSVNTHVWGVFLVTGLDKIFEFADDLVSSLAGLQLGAENV